MTIWHRVAVILLLAGCSAARPMPSSAVSAIERLQSDDPCVIRAAAVELHEMNVRAIPGLIERIDDRTPVRIFWGNPRRSIVHPEEGTIRRGVIAAYVIELILARPVLATTPERDCQFPLAQDDYLYEYGRIYQAPLTEAADLKVVRDLYRSWWRNHRHKSIATLRAEWKARQRPLTGSSFGWR